MPYYYKHTSIVIGQNKTQDDEGNLEYNWHGDAPHIMMIYTVSIFFAMPSGMTIVILY